MDANPIIDRALSIEITDDFKLSNDSLIECHKWINAYSARYVSIACINERLACIEKYRKQLEYLRTIPKIEQRTPEWYKTRESLITASDVGQAMGVGKFGTPRDIIIKKCGYKVDEMNYNVPPLRWGVKYEPVACALYEKKLHTRVYEFGLLRHPTVSFFGASPDGINQMGIMLEIKCPYRRKITGEVPEQYYYQIQGQLDVCGLSECDYLECNFCEYSSRSDFARDSDESGCLTYDMRDKGIIIEYLEPGDVAGAAPYQYIYGEINLTESVWSPWLDEQLRLLTERGVQSQDITITYWSLLEWHCKRIYKEPSYYMEDVYKKLGEMWKKIEDYRSDRALYDRDFATVGTDAGAAEAGVGAVATVATQPKGRKRVTNTINVIDLLTELENIDDKNKVEVKTAAEPVKCAFTKRFS
jgi:putative phage-type endonuclease